MKISSAGQIQHSRPEQLLNGIKVPSKKWFSLSNNKLNGTFHPMPARPRNLLDYSTWVIGTTGSQPGFYQRGDGNSIIEGLDPFGKTTALWRTLNNDTASDADGGWFSDYIDIDPNKLYRFSVWVKRKVLGNGRFYLGCQGYDASNSNIGVIGNDNGVTNYPYPYFDVREWNFNLDEWVLVVGHVYPHTHRETGFHPDSGWYDIHGNKIANLAYRDFRWRPETVKARHKTYLYYSTDPTTEQLWCYPRVEVCDGTEPTIQQLLESEIGEPTIGKKKISIPSAAFIKESGRLNGDPALSNGQNARTLGEWYCAMHYSPADEYIEVRTDGGPFSSKYCRIYDNGSGTWKAVMLTSNSRVNFKNYKGKWFRFTAWVRTSKSGTVGAYLVYDGRQGYTQWVSATTNAGEWTKLQATKQVPTDYDATYTGAAYLYGHHVTNAFTDWGAFYIEGPFDSDPGTDEYEVGFWSDSNKLLEIVDINEEIDTIRLTGDSLLGEYPVDFTIKVYDSNDNLLTTDTVTGNTLNEYTHSFSQKYNAARIEIQASQVSVPGSGLRLLEVELLNQTINANTKRSNDNINLTADEQVNITVLTDDILYVAIDGESKLTNIHTVMDSAIRQIKGKVEITYTDPFVDSTINFDYSSIGRNTYPEQLADSITAPTKKWFSLHDNKLDGTYHPLPDKKIVDIFAGYREGDLEFIPNQWNNAPSQGNIQPTGTHIVDWEGNRIDVTPLNAGISGPKGVGYDNKVMYIMYTQELAQTRFGIDSNYSAHLVTAEFKNGKWYAWNMNTPIEFEPRSSDLIVARFMTGIKWLENYKGVYKEPVDVGYTTPYKVGWWGALSSDSNGDFSTPQTFSVLFNPRVINKLKVVGDSLANNYPVDFTITIYDNTDTVLYTEIVMGNTEVYWEKDITPVLNAAKMTLSITKINKANQPCKILEFYTLIKEVYANDSLQFIELYEEIQPRTGRIPIGAVSSNELDVAIDNRDGKFSYGNINSPLNGKLKRNRKVKAWLGAEVAPNKIEWYLLGTFWTIQWNVPKNAHVAMVTARDRLEVMRFSEYKKSPVFVNQSLYAIFEAILQDYGLQSDEYNIDPELQNIIIPYAWFDQMSHRQALQRAASCSTAAVFCDREGVIQIKNVKPTDYVVTVLDDDTNVYNSDFPHLWDTTVNHIEVISKTYKEETDVEVLNVEDTISIPAYETVTKEYTFTTSPVLSVSDITSDKDSSINIVQTNIYSWGIEFTFENTGGASAEVRGITAIGNTLVEKGTLIASAKDEQMIIDDGELKETIEHDFIQNIDYAQQLAESLLESYKYSQQDAIYETRGDIALQLGDRVRSEGYMAGNLSDYMVVRQHLRWNGTLEATVESKKINT